MATKLERLKAAKTLSDVAKILGFKPKMLSYILYRLPPSSKYKHFKIKKKSGGERDILAPTKRLKLLQSRTNDMLSDCLMALEKKNIKDKKCVLSHGFKRGHSTFTNANVHKGRKWVFNVDLKDFFPSINFGRVRGFLISNKDFALEPNVATVVSQIVCHNNILPQGSPSSPTVSNLIAHIMDIHLNKLARHYGCSYTRYADDLTFSTNKKTFPMAIARPVIGTENLWVPGDGLVRIVSRSGFSINDRKTRMQYYWSRQEATGLVVNSLPNVPREYYKKARAICHRLFTKGETSKKSYFKDAAFEEPYTEDQIKGICSYIYHIRRSQEQSSFGPNHNIHKLYASVLDFYSFHWNQMPTIICEGKTDNIYIRCALRQLLANYPNFSIEPTEGVKQIGVRLFKYSRNTMELQSLGGGTGNLKSLISRYEKTVKQFTCNGTNQPVILLVDNDQGSNGKKGLFSTLKQVSGAKENIDGSKQFYHATQNLYVVPTPKKENGKDSMIEDFLPSDILKTKLDGKTLYLEKDGFDRHSHYGKPYLAERVVQPNWKKIDFSGYVPILDAFEAVRKTHSG